MKFTKVHGLGNDFVLIDAIRAPQRDYNALAKPLCHRQTGIGADGLLIVLPSEQADIRMRIINSDGSEAEMCGNGIRAFSKYVYEHGIVQKLSLTVETLAGVMKPQLVLENGHVSGVRVDMGKPGITCADVPVEGEKQSRCLGRTLSAAGREFTFSSVRVGVPHTAVFVDDPVQFDLAKYGPAIERHPLFPQRTNVNFVHVLDRENIVQRTWERGAGPTLACGTGSCGSAVCCMLGGLTERAVNVHLELGSLLIEWPNEDASVFMTGPAELVFEGEIPDVD